jgi:DNA replication and repair protein RecF
MIDSLRLQHYRSYDDASFEFDPGVTIIVGPNASGKTNLLEAILVTLQGHSYRVLDEELISFDKPWARLDAGLVNEHVNDDAAAVRTVREERAIKLDRSSGRLQKTTTIGGREYKIVPHAHALPAVLFEPNHLQLLQGAPDLRRNYLDDLLSQLRPGYTAMRQHYRRALSQRNALLKSGYDKARHQVFAWDLRLSELGGHIAEARMELAGRVAEALPPLYSEISHSNTAVTVRYHSSLPAGTYASALLHKLEHSLQTDCERGFTAYGPHRDDLLVEFDGRSAAESASRGEARTALLALKIIELQLLERSRGLRPVLLLDDVFSELDARRRHALTNYLQTYQTFITTTDADLVMKDFAQAASLVALA